MSMIIEDMFYTLDNDNISIMEEIEGGERQYWYKGNFGRANWKNANGRWYPTEVMAEAYSLIKKNMSGGDCLIGECGHPSDPNEAKRINFENICVTFPELTFNESTGYLSGIAKPTSFAKGEIAKGLIRDKIKVGFSTRAAGNVKPGKTVLGEDALIVQPGMKMIACDLVKNPSAGTFPKAIVESEEDKTYVRRIWTGADIIKNVF